MPLLDTNFYKFYFQTITGKWKNSGSRNNIKQSAIAANYANITSGSTISSRETSSPVSLLFKLQNNHLFIHPGLQKSRVRAKLSSFSKNCIYAGCTFHRLFHFMSSTPQRHIKFQLTRFSSLYSNQYCTDVHNQFMTFVYLQVCQFSCEAVKQNAERSLPISMQYIKSKQYGQFLFSVTYMLCRITSSTLNRNETYHNFALLWNSYVNMSATQTLILQSSSSSP